MIGPRLAMCALLIVSSACVLSAAEHRSKMANSPTMTSGSQVVCAIEYPTGSHIPRNVCRSIDKLAADRRAAEDIVLRPSVQKCQLGPCAAGD